MDEGSDSNSVIARVNPYNIVDLSPTKIILIVNVEHMVTVLQSQPFHTLTQHSPAV
jgi:hypothetical protein